MGADIMANEQNLVRGDEIHKFTPEEASKGGKASAEARRKKKALKECLNLLLEQEVGRDSAGNSISGAEAMATKAMKAALKGDWKAWELVRDTAGQKPVDKVMVADVDQNVIDEVESMVAGANNE